MDKKNKNLKTNIYPKLRYVMGGTRNSYIGVKNLTSRLSKRNKKSTVIPDSYSVCNTTTIDGHIGLNVIDGNLPHDISGNMYICQCLGSPEAFMVGDTNIVKISFKDGAAKLQNRLMWSPAAISRVALQRTKHRFEHMGLMFMSPGLGMFSYTEGMYLLPDGRLGITSDVDRPWVIDRENLRISTPLGRRDEWLPMMAGTAGDVMGNLFAGYSNSHVIYTDTATNELFLVNYQYRQADGSHPCILMKWDGQTEIKKWSIISEDGTDIEIKQSIHELIFTKDYILLADTAFVTGAEILSPWKNAPMPNTKTIVYVVDRRDMTDNLQVVTAKQIEIDEACIHLIADYENPDDILTIYMLHTPATNTAEIIRSYDKDLKGNLFPSNIVGYGTLPPLDLSSIGKHVVDMKTLKIESDYIRDKKYCWGPYMYSYMGRQQRNFNEQDLYVMFKGFKSEMLPQRVYNAYKDVQTRIVPLSEIKGGTINSNNSIARVTKGDFKIADVYEFPDKVLLYTISCMENSDKSGNGYLLAGVVTDIAQTEDSSGHEYWIFDAGNLAAGPICKLGHKSLNNSVLFHTVFLTSDDEAELNKKDVVYNVDLKDDYPVQEHYEWGTEVSSTFNEIIYPYFDPQSDKEDLYCEKILKEYSKNRIRTHAGKEHLIGEERLTDAPKFAMRMYDEAERMFRTTGWKIESIKDGVLVESKPVSGSFEQSGVLVTRAFGSVDADADTLFKYMTSPQGYAVIDPVSDPADHEKQPLEVYDWKVDARLEAAVASTNIPALGHFDFVVLNAIDPEKRIFASKSIQHDNMPGTSRYSSDTKPENGHERAINTFVIKLVPISADRCRAMCINYADMAGNTSATINNMINTKAFFGPLYKRMRLAAKEL